jgi:hypothetical protein
MHILDGWAGTMAMRLVTWLDGRVDASRRGWIAALAAETENIDGGWSKLRWAISGLPLAWSFRRPPVPRVAGAWSTAVNPRLYIAALNRNSADLISYTTTISLIGIVVVLAVFIMPVFQAMLASAGLSLPLAARIVLRVISSPYFVYGVLLTPLLLHWHTVRTGKPAISARRALPVLNFLCVVALVGMITGFVGFLTNLRPVVAAIRASSGVTAPAPSKSSLLPSQQSIQLREHRRLAP